MMRAEIKPQEDITTHLVLPHGVEPGERKFVLRLEFDYLLGRFTS